ncbi:MAG: glycosyl hydrolase 115 family protein, partial [Bacteroidales bacterium]|nr:glycosyl hydrolase 115 family protein [Bacteroidales bacterium]
MKRTKKAIPAILLCLNIIGAHAQVRISESRSGKDTFQLAGKTAATICYDATEAAVVKTAAELLASDIWKITGQEPVLAGTDATQEGNLPKADSQYAVIAGTIGNSIWIDSMIKAGKIDVSSIEGGWEQYAIRLVNNPCKGLKKAIIVAGSDRRGTAYGLMEISRRIGVNPWYWWLDAPIPQQSQITLSVTDFDSKSPSVKYRGIFINDEDWGLLRWAKKNFEKELGNIGPKTYDKVCELLLRLKANMLAPAMHEASTAFYQIPENKEIADKYAIIITTSHCEPLLLNTASEWFKDRYGEWNYNSNMEKVDSVLKARVTEASPYENVYTLALRGLHDRAMSGDDDLDARKETMQEALINQRKILEDVLGREAADIPQAFTPYKEVLDVFNRGLELPEDVTIVWPDDNYGYMKRLSSPKEQQRSGRSGVYYHSSYLGRPHDYLWMNTTSPTVMYEELRKAYDSTADRFWLLNAGDIKSCEFAVDFFLSMAYDIDSFNYMRAASYRAEWLGEMLGNDHYGDFQAIFDEFYHQAFIRKPEFMGWGYQWATDKHGNERNTDTDFSFANYREAERRIDSYMKIADQATGLMERLPESHQACFYQAVYYPVKACELLNRMVLDGQKNRWYALQNRAATDQLAETAKACHDSLRTITDGYNRLLDGKWDHVMTMGQGFAASYFKMPVLKTAALSEKPEMGIMAENEGSINGVSSWHQLPTFNRYHRCSYYVDVFNKGKGELSWNAKADKPWIKLDKSSGTTSTEERAEVSIDWDSVPYGNRIAGTLTFTDASGAEEKVLVSVFNPASPSMEEVSGIYVQHNGYISIDAAGYHRKRENDRIKITDIPNLGIENAAIQLGDPKEPKQNTRRRDVPLVEYDFYTFEQGSVDVYTYVLPTFVLNADRGYAGHEATNLETQYGVCIDEGPVMNPSTSSIEYAQIWYESALKNCRVNKTTLHINEPGRHTLKILCGDAGTVVQKIVLDFGGLKRSYTGPQP